MSIESLASNLPEIGTRFGRFLLESVDQLDEYQSFGLLFREEKSGCEIYHVWNEDEENLFSFNFKTIPEDSSGVAHILEHTVLCGSEKYPVKDPFVMLYKGSMQTFLNAMTYPDKTVYPASSTVKQDLFNLMSVYADAVFFPLLKEEHFRQEGHRLERGDDGEIQISGVVYNEMKANYSTHDDIAWDKVIRSVFPDTPYAHDSGGDPREIPGLRYSYFRDFHRRYYHPSNCRIFLYGDIPTADYLDFLEREVFSRFSDEELSRRQSFELPLQPRWDSPRQQRVSYPVAEGSSEAGDSGCSVNLSWMLEAIDDAETALAVELLSDVLLGNPASPIQKVINESDLGEDMSSTSGFENEFLQLVFSIGMRGTREDRAQAVEDLIMDGLARVVEEGINPDLLEGSLRRFEFRSREIKGGGPFGLRLLSRSMRAWLHGRSPRHSMDFAPVLASLKERIAGDGNYLTGLIRSLLIDNPHRSRVTMVPDANQNARDDRAESDMVSEKLKALGESAADTVAEWTDSFAAFQAEPDRPEDLAKLPFLSVEDIPSEIRTIPNIREDLERGTVLYHHDVFTNGISYLDFGFDISALDHEHQLFLPLLTHMLPQVGSAERNYEDMNLQWGLKTGGFSVYGENSSTIDGRHLQHCYLRLKTLDDMAGEGIALVGEVLSAPDFDDHSYLWELFSEYRNDLRSGIIPSGTNYAAVRATRGLNERARVDDLWRGVEQQRFIEELYAWAGRNRGEALEFLAHRLKELSAWVFSSDALILNVTAEANQANLLRGLLEGFASGLGIRGETGLDPDLVRRALGQTAANLGEAPALREGIEHSSKVNFTAMALRASHLSSRGQVAELVLAHILRTGLLWEKIRMEGGAYGAFAVPDGLSDLFVFGSYRDPNITESWQAYVESLQIISDGALDQQTLDLAKIAIAGRELRPMSPAEQGLVSFKRVKYGISDELRTLRRGWLIECRLEEVASAAKRLLSAVEDARYAVLGDPKAIENLAHEYPELRRTVMR
jgi:Zn-dependent M16 (insulinase) family peptidase